MTESYSPFPLAYPAILSATEKAGFAMASDPATGSLLRTLAVSKPAGAFLELGTGTGLSTSWILDGMDARSTLTSFDFDSSVLDIAQQFLGEDPRLTLACIDGEKWVMDNLGKTYDYIFADTWHGKYLLLEEVLAMLKVGGIYILDDMLPQPNWPEGHADKAQRLVEKLESLPFLKLTKLHWSTGIILATKISQ